MPISEQCLGYYKGMLSNYQKKGSKDRNYGQILQLLQSTLLILQTDASEFDDEKIISDYAINSAAISFDNPVFKQCCEQFFRACNTQLKPYQARSRSSLLFVSKSGQLLTEIHPPQPFHPTKTLPKDKEPVYSVNSSVFYQSIHAKATELQYRKMLSCSRK